MKIVCSYIGKTKADYLKEGLKVFGKRIPRYVSFQEHIIPDLKKGKNLSIEEIKIQEGEKILATLQASDILVLLDEKGKHYSSVAFSVWFQHKMNLSTSKVVFQVGGAYGFSQAVYERANEKIALSSMTFSHQMIRLLLVEQIYRAMTIIRNEPYHNI